MRFLPQFGARRYAHNRQIAESTLMNYLAEAEVLFSRFLDLLVENHRPLISLPARHLCLLASTFFEIRPIGDNRPLADLLLAWQSVGLALTAVRPLVPLVGDRKYWAPCF